MQANLETDIFEIADTVSMVVFRFVEDGKEIELSGEEAVKYAKELYERGMVLLYDNSAVKPEDVADKNLIEVMGFVCD